MDCCDPPTTLNLRTTDREQDLVVRGFVALWNAQLPRPADLDADPATIQSLQTRGLLVLSDDGHIIGIHGLSARPTAHQITHPGGTIHTWCAFDAIGIPAALGLDARTHTTCPTCGQPLEVNINAGQASADPQLQLWLPTAKCEHVLDELCAHANLYCNQQHLAASIPEQAIGSILTITNAAQLGQSTWNAAATALQSP